MANQPNNQRPNQAFKNIFVFMAIVVGLMLINSMMQKNNEKIDIEFSQFIEEVKSDKISEATIKGQQIEGVYGGEGGKFTTIGPLDSEELRKELESQGVKVNFGKPEEGSYWQALLINSIPIIFLFLLFLFFMRQLQGGGGKAMSFGKSRAKLLTDVNPKVTFKDIAGIDEAKMELKEIIEFLKDPKKFTRLGGRIPKGVLLIGSPGTGKTILARGVAGEAGVPFFSISGSDFVEMFVGVGASRVRDLFEQAKKNAPCIIFIDEIDAVGRQRGAGLGGGHDEREQTLNQLLVEMDGFESNEGVIVIAASNRADVLDPALLRPGRFDRRVVVPKPDVKGRLGILSVHSKKSPLSDNVDFAKIAQGTPGFSGADLENLVNEAALIAAREDANKIEMLHFELAKDKVLMGPERRSMIMTEEEKRNTSYHEAGHALVGLKLKSGDPVHKVSIIPRGQALGVTITLPVEDRYTITREFAEGMIAYAMGGRAAEELMFNQFTTGASNDIGKATEIARKMVCQWGMSEAIGPLALDDKSGQEVFLGRDFTQGKHFSEKVAAEVDQEVHRLVTDGYRKALQILKDNKDTLTNMAEALLVKETLDSTELEKIMKGENVVSEAEKKAYEERIKTKPNGVYEIVGEKLSEDTDEAEKENGSEKGEPSHA